MPSHHMALAHLDSCVCLDLCAACGLVGVEVGQHTLPHNNGTSQGGWHGDDLTAACLEVGLVPGPILKLLGAGKKLL